MHYNANTGGTRQGLGRKIKRVSDVNAMGYNPYEQGTPQAPTQNIYPNLENNTPTLNQPDYMQPQYSNQPFNVNTTPQQPYQYNPGSPYMNNPPSNTPFGVFGQPVMQDMALQYGQQLANTGTSMIKKEVGKYVPVSKLKYYFAVDTKYVISKLGLLFFPFTHKDWSLKYEQDGPVQPRYEINAPDLYIPTMAYITYVLVAGMVLGMQQRFSPEQIGILSSSALAWCIVELAIYSCALYIAHIETSLRTLDLLAYSGYKFVGIIVSILLSIVGGRTAYYACLIYSSLSLAFFLVRSLKAQVLSETTPQAPGYYDVNAVPTPGNKRRLYFLLFVAGIQPVLSWWLSFHLIGSKISDTSKSIES